MQNDTQVQDIDLGMIGVSPAMQQVRQLVVKAAATEATVLILGETGTGKELIAKAIHRQSARCGSPYIGVNCGAIPDTLIESELFGYEKGAFSGAAQKKDGLFAAAVKGTIFLDEINSTDKAFQVKLLRVLQEKQITPVGGTEAIPLDVRVIAATNEDLALEVREGRFRKDLYYRLNVLTLVAPPLRERGDDVVLLAEHFLNKYAKRDGKVISGFTSTSIDGLRKRPWSGNVRELENVVERAVVWSPLVEGQLLDVSFSELDLSVTSASLSGTQGEDIGARAAGVRSIADIVFNELLNGQPPLLGLRKGNKEIGPLARLVIEGLVQGYRHYLSSDQGQKALSNFGDRYLLAQIGLAERKGRSGEAVLNSELRQLIGQLLASQRGGREGARVP